MIRVEERLGEMGVTLPNLPTPIANFVPAKRAGNLVFTAGQVSAVEGRPLIPPSLLERGMDGAMKVSHGGKS